MGAVQHQALLMEKEAAAAFPQVITTSGANNGTSRTTSSNVTLPTGIVSGDLVILAFGCESNNAAPTTPTDWTIIGSVMASGSDRYAIYYRIATGALTSVTVTHGNARTSWAAARISGRQGNPEWGTAATGTGTTPDAPTATASWGSANNLFLAICFFTRNNAATPYTAFPTNYGQVVQQNGITSNQSTAISIRSRELASNTDNPGTWTVDPSDEWGTQTVVIRPA